MKSENDFKEGKTKLGEDTQPIDLHPIWEALLCIYEEIKRICEKHKLCFFADSGTMLGAVRHKGFIPWDDDLDLRMPREDFEVFMKIAPQELSPYFKIINWQNTSEYPNLFAKVQDVRQDNLNNVMIASGCSLPQGLYVDIFPFDGYPNGLLTRFWYRVCLCSIRIYKIYLFNRDFTGWRSVLSGKIGWIMRPFFRSIHTRDDYFLYVENLVKRYSPKRSKYIGWTTMEKVRMPRTEAAPNSWNERLVLPFEQTTIPVPLNFDDTLRALYGDYMQLPPECDRIPKHSKECRAAWILGPTRSPIQGK